MKRVLTIVWNDSAFICKGAAGCGLCQHPAAILPSKLMLLFRMKHNHFILCKRSEMRNLNSSGDNPVLHPYCRIK